MCFVAGSPAASEIQMMALPHAQYVIAEASTAGATGNSSQVKTVSQSMFGRAQIHAKPLIIKCI